MPWVSDRQPYWLARLTREHPNLRAAVEYCLKPGPLIGLSLAALRGRLTATILLRVVGDRAAAIARVTCRRAHQSTAMISHYGRRGDQLPPPLRI